MAYKRTNWKSGAEGGTLITDERLNNIEDGIQQALAGVPDVALPDAVMTTVASDPSTAFATLQSATYASQLTATVDTTAAVISAWLAAPSPLGVKRLVGDVTVTEPITVPSNCYFDATSAPISLDPNASCSILVNDWANGNVNIKLIGLTLDGARSDVSDPRSPASWHAVYFKNVVGLTLVNITVRDPLAFGGLYVSCSDVFVSNYRSDSHLINQDGIHFFDCEDVIIDGLRGVAGDDLLGMSAEFGDLRNITVSSVTGQSVNGSLVRINQTDRSVAAGETRTIDGIHLSGIVGYDCGNKGLSINDVHPSSTVRDIHLSDATFLRTARSGIDIVRAEDSYFDATLIDCGTGIGVTTQLTLHPFYAAFLEDSEVKPRVIGVTEGYDAVHISAGNTLEIHPKVDYPTDGMTNQQMCVWLGSVTDSVVSDGYTDGGSRGVQLGTSTASAQRVRVTNMLIRNNTGSAIAEGSTSDFNLITNNHIKTGGITKVGANTIVQGNLGLKTEAHGPATILSGQTAVTVTHGVTGTPTTVMITGRHAEVVDAYVSAITSTTFTVTVPSAVTADRPLMWDARV